MEILLLVPLGIALLAYAGERYEKQYGSPYDEVDKASDDVI